MRDIARGVRYLTREDWGADPNIRGGAAMNGAAEKTEIPIHHTVVVDNDASPDLWETEREVKAKMRQLQVIRSDITDVPYNAVGFLMADGNLIVCEGRGPNRSGAHTIGHNRIGYGFAFEGNMEAAPNPNVSRWVPKLNQFFGWVKSEQLPRLGPFFPHQAVSATACPGRAVLREIEQFRYGEAEEDEMKLILLYLEGEPHGSYWLSDWIQKRSVGGQEALNLFRVMEVPDLALSQELLDTIPDVLE